MSKRPSKKKKAKPGPWDGSESDPQMKLLRVQVFQAQADQDAHQKTLRPLVRQLFDAERKVTKVKQDRQRGAVNANQRRRSKGTSLQKKIIKAVLDTCSTGQITVNTASDVAGKLGCTAKYVRRVMKSYNENKN